MRQEHDPELDIMRIIHSDRGIVRTEEYVHDDARFITHYDVNAQIVQNEIHGYSKILEKQQNVKRSEYLADPDDGEVLGRIEWNLYDRGHGRIVANGVSEPKRSQFKIGLITEPSSELRHVSFPLAENILLGLGGGRYATEDISGFALVGRLLDVQSFSWDWFHVDRPNHGMKIQESGELRFEAGNPSGQYEVLRTEFLTDVSVRIARIEEQVPKDEPSWRLNIAKGSHLFWPTVVNGKVV